MNPEYLDDITPSEETEEVSYGFCIPLKAGGFAWLVDMCDDVDIRKSVDGHWYKLDGSLYCYNHFLDLKKYLGEIKSGKGNWIINPINDNTSGCRWGELDYENAAVVKCVAKVTYQYTYEEVDDFK